MVVPPDRNDLRRYAIPMLGLYPARGCPFRCNFCSVIKIAGRRIRKQPVETTLASLRAARAAGVGAVFGLLWIVIGMFFFASVQLVFLGIVGVYTVGSFIHALLVIALVLFVLSFVSGRRVAL